jgi:hypothetical protein
MTNEDFRIIVAAILSSALSLTVCGGGLWLLSPALGALGGASAIVLLALLAAFFGLWVKAYNWFLRMLGDRYGI